MHSIQIRVRRPAGAVGIPTLALARVGKVRKFVGLYHDGTTTPILTPRGKEIDPDGHKDIFSARMWADARGLPYYQVLGGYRGIVLRGSELRELAEG